LARVPPWRKDAADGTLAFRSVAGSESRSANAGGITGLVLGLDPPRRKRKERLLWDSAGKAFSPEKVVKQKLEEAGYRCPVTGSPPKNLNRMRGE
jgi:hypothetical protein